MFSTYKRYPYARINTSVFSVLHPSYYECPMASLGDKRRKSSEGKNIKDSYIMASAVSWRIEMVSENGYLFNSENWNCEKSVKMMKKFLLKKHKNLEKRFYSIKIPTTFSWALLF